MKLPFPPKTTRRTLSIALVLALALVLLPFALAGNSSQPPATTGDAVAAKPSEDVTVPSGDAAVPSGDVTTGSAAEVTTDAAANLLLLGENQAALNGSVLTITWNDDGSGGTSLDNNNMKTLLDSVSNMPEWNALTRVELEGTATQITNYNWQYLRGKYSDKNAPTPPTLDLSGSALTVIKDGNADNISRDLCYVKNVILPNSLTEIGNHAFQDCAALTSITLPQTLTEIGALAFYRCPLISIALPDSVTTIGNSAFNFCEALTSVHFPASLKTVGTYAFAVCKTLASVDLSGCTSLTEISDSMFLQCYALASVDLSGCTKLETIGQSAFESCKLLAQINLSGCTSLETIGDSAFEYCEVFKGTIFPSSLKKIGDNAFCRSGQGSGHVGGTIPAWQCDLPEGLTSIGNSAFLDANLGILRIPGSITHMGDHAFSNNYYLSLGQHRTVAEEEKVW